MKNSVKRTSNVWPPILVCLLLMQLTIGSSAAQITPDVDFKASSSSATLPNALSQFERYFSDPKFIAGLSLNFQPVAEMLKQLEKRGAKLEARLVELKNVRFLEFKVDGQKLPPLAVQCNDCVIIFEY